MDTRQQLVEKHAKGKNVRTEVDLFTSQLLRRHVPGRPQHRTRLGEAGRRGRLTGTTGRQTGQTEVENLDTAIRRADDVFRLEIPMNNPLLVRGGEGAADLHGGVEK